MADLSLEVMGLKLKNPIIVGSSSLTSTVESIKKLEMSGAGAVVLKSLFEEQIMNQVYADTVNYTHAETLDYVKYFEEKHIVEKYLKLIKDSKNEIGIPIIASINCNSHGKWVEFAEEIQNSGADAIELNLYNLPSDPKINQHNYMETASKIINDITKHISIPFSMKLSPYSDNLAYDLLRISRTKISGLVLFNRSLNPDIDIKSESLINGHPYSSPGEIVNTLRWTAICSDFLETDLIAATGIHDGEGIIKQILAGAKAVQMVSSLYINSLSAIKESLTNLENWMNEHKYNKLSDFRGKLKRSNVKDPKFYDRVQFIQSIQNNK
ncbi:MAG: dihydroorotate dehydrogenase-like protein [Candidatus Delongbacteria bacterium]|nr:dihydroorotate dehydrogenase-like protein [Candidatus Delongbacteria bacterium]